MTRETVAIVLAGGFGERLGLPEPKAFVEVAGRPMVVRAVEAAAACPAVDSLVVAVPAGWEGRATALLTPGKPLTIVAGGSTRHASVRAALEAAEEAPFVLCHDAARPFAPTRQFALVLGALDASPEAAGAVPIVPVADTVERIRDGIVAETIGPREELGLAQTPQAFRAAALRDAHARATAAARDFSDDAGLVQWAGYRVIAVAGEAGNFKITTGEDLALAEVLAAERARG